MAEDLLRQQRFAPQRRYERFDDMSFIVAQVNQLVTLNEVARLVREQANDWGRLAFRVSFGDDRNRPVAERDKRADWKKCHDAEQQANEIRVEFAQIRFAYHELHPSVRRQRRSVWPRRRQRAINIRNG